MFNETFLLAIGLVIVLWIAVTLYERRSHQREIERVRKRLRRKQASRQDEDG